MVKDSWSDETTDYGEALSNETKTTPSSLRPGRRNRNVAASQEAIYDFLLEIVKSWQPDRVLEHFKNLFIYNLNTPQVPCSRDLQDILINNDEIVFFQTLKRCCYIVINNWDHAQKGHYVQELVKSFEDSSIYRFGLGDMTQRLRAWLRAFVESQDYEHLRLFARQFEDKKKRQVEERQKSWSDRYAHYQLINQAEDLTNPEEQREAAKTLTKQAQSRFRLDLALYVAHGQSSTLPIKSAPLLSKNPRENPTGLGGTTINLIKSLVMRKGFFGPENLARIFLEQVQNLSYESYKDSLLNYLTYSSTEEEKKHKKGFAPLLKYRLGDRLNQLYVDKNLQQINSDLMLRTCNQVIGFLTTENNQDPSHAFLLFVSQGHALLLAIVLLKIILISPASRNHLDLRIAKLVQYYIRLHQEKNLEESHYFGYFLDIINVILAIYTEGVSYNVIQSKDSHSPTSQGVNPLKTFGEQITETQAENPSLEAYRIFSQSKTVEPPKPESLSEPSPDPLEFPVTNNHAPALKSNRRVLYDAVTGEEVILENEPPSL